MEDDTALVNIRQTVGLRFMPLIYHNHSLLATGCYEAEDSGLARMGGTHRTRLFFLRAVLRRLVAGIARDLAHWPGDPRLVLPARPSRIPPDGAAGATSRRRPYAQIQHNLLAAGILPIDLLRCKLAFFGASHAAPRPGQMAAHRLFQGRAYPEDLNAARNAGL